MKISLITQAAAGAFFFSLVASLAVAEQTYPGTSPVIGAGDKVAVSVEHSMLQSIQEQAYPAKATVAVTTNSEVARAQLGSSSDSKTQAISLESITGQYYPNTISIE